MLLLTAKRSINSSVVGRQRLCVRGKGCRSEMLHTNTCNISQQYSLVRDKCECAGTTPRVVL